MLKVQHATNEKRSEEKLKQLSGELKAFRSKRKKATTVNNSDLSSGLVEMTEDFRRERRQRIKLESDIEVLKQVMDDNKSAWVDSEKRLVAIEAERDVLRKHNEKLEERQKKLEKEVVRGKAELADAINNICFMEKEKTYHFPDKIEKMYNTAQH